MFGLGQLGTLGLASSRQNPAWVLAGAAADLDFAHGRAFGAPPASLAVSRASIAYANDSFGQWLAFAANALRLTDRGILLEESRSNGIRNNAAQGIVVGTLGAGGALPTYWDNYSVSNGITVSILGGGSELGVNCVDIRLQGTPSLTTNQRLAFDTQIAAANGQTWAMSAFIKVAGGSLTNVGSCLFAHQFRDGAGVSLTVSTGPPFTPTGTLARYGALGTATHASTALVEPELNIGLVNGQAIDVTFRIGWPQQELGAFVTSPIRTTGAAATRAGDVVTLTGLVFGPAFSVYAQGVSAINPGSAVGAPRLINLGDGTINNCVELLLEGNSGRPDDLLRRGGVIAYNTQLASAGYAGQSVKVATALAAGDQAAAAAGALTTHAAASIIAPSALTIGASAGGGAQWNGFVERVALWPTTRIPNAMLVEMTR